MNNKGFIINVVAFICAILLAGLIIVVADPIQDGALDAAPGVAPENGTARMIIFGSAIVVLLAGVWFLTRGDGQLGFNL